MSGALPPDPLDARDDALVRAVDAEMERALAAVSRLAPSFPGDAATGLLSQDEGADERFAADHAAVPCPALDPETGRCDLYAWRPLACRTLGPPARIGETDLAPCPWCFGPASAADLERCRARPDPEAAEDALVVEVERRLGREGETTVAFALAGRPAPGEPVVPVD